MGKKPLKNHSKKDNRGGLQNFKGKENTNGFDKHQPSPEALSNAKKLKAKGRELAKAILSLKYKGLANSDLRKQMSDYFEVPEDELTIDMMIDFRQIEKAIGKSDTPAAKFIKESAYGQPKQETDLNVKGQGIVLNIVADEKEKKILDGI